MVKIKMMPALAGLLTGSLAVSLAIGQSPGPRTPPSSWAASTARSERGVALQRRLWGIDNIRVRSTSSGALVRFSYRVVDAEKAAAMNDKKLTPYLMDETTGAALQVPVMEKVGQLRQTAMPVIGREYWMVFSNKGGYVKPGNRVDIVIGNVRINGLIVE